MVELLQYALNGLANGFVISLLALSVVMIYQSTRVLSFAQGGISSLTTYVYYQLSTVWTVPVLVAFPIALVAAAGIGVGAEAAALRPLRRADALTRTVATLGVFVVLQVIMRFTWGGDQSFVRPLVSGRISIAGFSMSGQEVITALFAVTAAAALTVLAKRTYVGLGLSAIAENTVAARLLGVAPASASGITWALAAVLAGLAGVLATPLLVLNPFQMTLIMVTSYGAALLGRFMSLTLALIGGMLIGVVQSIVTGFITVSGASEAFGFVVVFLVLLGSRGRRDLSGLLQKGAEAW